MAPAELRATSATEQALWKPVIERIATFKARAGEARSPFALAAAALVLAAATADAQDGYPNSHHHDRAVRGGGSTDVIGRLIAEGLRRCSASWWWWTIAPARRLARHGAIAKAAPDGYTIGIGTASTLAINPATYKNLPFDVLTDLAPIGNIAAVPISWRCIPACRRHARFIALAKSQPGRLVYRDRATARSRNCSASSSSCNRHRLLHVPIAAWGPR